MFFYFIIMDYCRYYFNLGVFGKLFSKNIDENMFHTKLITYNLEKFTLQRVTRLKGEETISSSVSVLQSF